MLRPRHSAQAPSAWHRNAAATRPMSLLTAVAMNGSQARSTDPAEPTSVRYRGYLSSLRGRHAACAHASHRSARLHAMRDALVTTRHALP